jgi:hypothetical protein
MNAMTYNERVQTMSVFLYHGVVSNPPEGLARRERKYWMDTGAFRRHLSLLTEIPHAVRSLNECWRAKTHASHGHFLFQDMTTSRPAVLTFDDGYESDFTVVWPLLQAAGIPATFFVNTATLGRPGHLRWSQVRHMCEEGASFQSHAHRHVDLTQLRAQALQTELRLSKDLIEGWVKKPVDFLAVPYGRISRRVFDAALEAGYRAVCTSNPRLAFAGTQKIGRVAIHADTKPNELARLIDGYRFSYWSRNARAAALAPLKAVLRPPSPKGNLRPETTP